MKYAVDDCTSTGQGHRVDSDVASRDACIAECETFLGTSGRSGEHGYMTYESGKKECFCYIYSDADPLEITCNKVLFKGPAIIDGSAFFEDQMPSTNVVISGGMPYDSHMDAMNHAACTASSGGTGTGPTPTPPPSPSLSPAGGSGDPHLHFAHGGRADFRGRDGARTQPLPFCAPRKRQSSSPPRVPSP